VLEQIGDRFQSERIPHLKNAAVITAYQRRYVGARRHRQGQMIVLSVPDLAVGEQRKLVRMSALNLTADRLTPICWPTSRPHGRRRL
jgi:hypothetical protein